MAVAVAVAMAVGMAVAVTVAREVAVVIAVLVARAVARAVAVARVVARAVATTVAVAVAVTLARAVAYLEADVRRIKRKMGGFISWEIFGTGFKILIFLQFSCDVQVSKFWIFLRFSAIFRGLKKFSKHGFFCSVSGF
jgi:hypothetical protein